MEKTMAKTKFEEMFDRLPSNIKETEVLREESKKVLAALLELLLHSEARESRVIYASNSRLRKLSGIDKKKVLPSIEQLIDYDLISRKVGTFRKKGEASGEASEYIINFNKLKEPLVEKTFDDLFSEFLEDDKSSEKPINPAITITTTTSNSKSNTKTNTKAMSNTNSNTVGIYTEVKDKFKLLEEFVNKQFDNCKTYQETISQISSIYNWIHERYSDSSNVDPLTDYANELIDKKLSAYSSPVNVVTTETVQVEDDGLPF